MKRTFLSLFLLLAALPSARAAVVGKEIEYSVGDVKLKGYLAYDDAVEGRRPGVLVVHEWWGHNDYARKRARMLAGLGYTAFAVDMYGDGKQAQHPDDAGKFAGEVMSNMKTASARFNAALKLLREQPTTAPDRVAAIGYCFGGGVVLAMAREGADLKGVVSFHGSLGAGAPVAEGTVKARILVCNGADDSFTTAEQIATFKSTMDAAKVKYTFMNYPGAKHSFTNPDADNFAKKFSLPLAYNEKADQDSWKDMQAFFKEIF